MEETITIAECPHCKQTHKYSLQVERTMVIKLMVAEDLNNRPKPIIFSRIFTCPNKNEQFQAQITLFQSSTKHINSVGQDTKLIKN